MGKDKLRKFKENESFSCLIQPSTAEVLGKDHPLKGNWGRTVFGNDNPIVVELGCGKGEYTIDLALRNPGCNYIGVDIKGARLWKGAKYAHEHALPNVAFLRTRIEFIESLFGPGEVSEIWITFADPQIGREKKRLTSPLFLSRYRNFLKSGGIVHLKTDSRYLHEYSRSAAEQNGLEILALTTDLYGEAGGGPAAEAGGGHEAAGRSEACGKPEVEVRSEAAGGLRLAKLASVCGQDAVDALYQVQTFYESQYLAQGIPITYLAFRIDHEGPYISPDWDPDRWER